MPLREILDPSLVWSVFEYVQSFGLFCFNIYTVLRLCAEEKDYLAFSSAFFLSVLTTTLMVEGFPSVPVADLVLLTKKSSPIISFIFMTSHK